MKQLTLPFIWAMALCTLHGQSSQVQWRTTAEPTGALEYHLRIEPVLDSDIRLVDRKGNALDVEFLDPENTFVFIGNPEMPQPDAEGFLDPSMEIVQLVLVPDSGQAPDLKGLVSYTLDTGNGLVRQRDSLSFTFNAGAAETAPLPETAPEKGRDRSLWTLFVLSFLGGFAALLTPCVFPMIPMTVSFFTKQSRDRRRGITNALWYGLCIIVIYVVLGSLVTSIFGAGALNALSTNVWFNLIFFLLLVVFALSFLGAFELVLPSRWLTKVDNRSQQGGWIGIFFMALALAIVSFSCTGPIVGTLLVEAASKGGMAPIWGMVGFSLALALPFALFAAFPGWLNSLPRSGGWLNTVKVFLGFLELALAFKFLSNADLVLQLHWFEREVFLVLWIAIFAGLALYLLGQLRLPHDAPLSHIGVGRLCLGLLTLAFALYMVPGLWGAPLKLISGFPPPMHYSESPHGVGGSAPVSGNLGTALPEGASLGPHDIPAFHDYEKGLAHAQKVGSPVLLDFTGHACVNCRKMEERVWSEPRILELLRNEFVLVSLYVDDKRPLAGEETLQSEITGRPITTTGQKWSELQQIKYRANAQPLYAILGGEGQDLVPPVGYTPDVQDYRQWLESGLQQFAKSEFTKDKRL